MKSLLSGLGFGCIFVIACASAPTYREPPSWTLRADGRLRASQRGENFSFEEWKEKYLSKEGKDFGAVLTPAGAKKISDELARRNAKIIELENYISNGCR